MWKDAVMMSVLLAKVWGREKNTYFLGVYYVQDTVVYIQVSSTSTF